MKIRLLSDLHRETGPFSYEDHGEDVVVLAGDIDVGARGIEWAKTIPKPVIYVAGNHEFWGGDLEQVSADMRAAAKGSNVHFLERDSVTMEINGERVRFLGCTLWTSFMGGNRNMVYAAKDGVRDYVKIRAGGWNKRNQRKIAAFEKRLRYESFPESDDQLHPAMLYDLHQRSVRWLEKQLESSYGDMVVVVTHHAPSMQSLLRARMISPGAERNFDKIRWREEEAMRMAAYASDLDLLIKRYESGMALWCHGHTHEPLDYALNSVRIACNPRGYHDKPLAGDGIFLRPSTEAVERDQREFALSPERGTTRGFERDKTIDTDDGLVPCLVPQAREKAEEWLPIIEELRKYIGNPQLEDPGLKRLLQRGLHDAASEANRIREEILEECELGTKFRFTGGVCFPGTISLWPDERSPGQVLQELIDAIERTHDFFDGDGYEHHIASTWDQFSKHWICAVSRG